MDSLMKSPRLLNAVINKCIRSACDVGGLLVVKLVVGC